MQTATRPMWFRVVAELARLWNLVGLFMFWQEMTLTPEAATTSMRISTRPSSVSIAVTSGKARAAARKASNAWVAVLSSVTRRKTRTS